MKKVENPYDNLPIKRGNESDDVIGGKEKSEIESKLESSLREDSLSGN